MKTLTSALALLGLAAAVSAAHGEGPDIPEVDAIVASITSELHAWMTYSADPEPTPFFHPKPQPTPAPPSQYWLGQIKHQGVAPLAASGYQVFRNVKDFGAKGDGVTDDTAAINAAVSAGNRCGPNNCSSTTVTPAVVYFPPGQYLLTSSITDFYFTMLLGDAVDLPVLKAAPNFGGNGLGLIDGDRFHQFGATNIFYRQVQNFIIDMTDVAPVNQNGGGPTGIHWPTAQATSIQNVKILMSDAPNTSHIGIFIEDGSGGFMSDVVFVGGKVGGQFGNQQFTMRNLTFSNCRTAISHSFDWGWTYAGITVSNCSTAIDITSPNGNGGLNVNSITLIDSDISDTAIFVKTGRTNVSQPVTANSLALENIRLTNVGVAIQGPNNTTLLEGTAKKTTIQGYVAGHAYTPTGPSTIAGPRTPFKRPESLVTRNGDFYTRSKPQYETVPVSQFISARDFGAKGDGQTDDTNALNQAIAAAVRENKILFVDAGLYKVTSTVRIPPGARIVGEAYPNIMAAGEYFSDISNPKPVIQVGLPGQSGQIEWSNMVVSTQGSTIGAILIEYNLASSAEKPSGLWDVHIRVGGFAGSNLQLANCRATTLSDVVNPDCLAAYMMMHVTKTATGLYMENNWLWCSDHDMEDPQLRMVDVYSLRGFLVESVRGNIWLWGHAVEHNSLYQYEFSNTQNVFMGQIQTETAYYEPHPNSTAFQTRNSQLSNHFGGTDPDFETFCKGRNGTCEDGWALRILSSEDILAYGVGLYSFFSNHNVSCSGVNVENCQTQIFVVDAGVNPSFHEQFERQSRVRLYNLNTVGSVSMINVGGKDVAFQADNAGDFPQNVALFTVG